jgi:hypothetical protein
LTKQGQRVVRGFFKDDTDIRTFQVWDVNLSTGEVHLYPVRQGRTLNTEPMVAYYTQLRKILA